MRKLSAWLGVALLVLVALSACSTAEPTLPASVALPTSTPTPTPTQISQKGPAPTPTAAATSTPADTPTSAPPATPTAEPGTPTPATDVETPAPTPTQEQASVQPTPAWQIPSPRETDWAKGNPEAKLVIVEYSDFQCPYCSGAAQVLTRVVGKIPDDLYVIFRHFPLSSIHPNAVASSEAAEAAGVQGKFWEMHDLLFARQPEWSSASSQQLQGIFAGYATELGLD
ncbi:MAG: thioredoxin domain-containing protein, partial [Anaerolineae bacterium]|nr:thioredoxin domain-containing protein [Anaerolineae bacterium]